jgi:hypothetical protein
MFGAEHHFVQRVIPTGLIWGTAWLYFRRLREPYSGEPSRGPEVMPMVRDGFTGTRGTEWSRLGDIHQGDAPAVGIPSAGAGPRTACT